MQRALCEAEKLDQLLVYQFASPVFHVDTYFSQLLTQTLPYMCMIVFPSWCNYNAMGFLTCTPGPLFFNFFMTLCPYLIVGLYFVLLTFAYEEMEPLQNAIFFPLLYWFMHVNTRAIKYATLHKVELAKFMASETYAQAAHYQASLQLSSSWGQGSRSDALLDFEIASASCRLGCDLSSLAFVVQDPSVSLAAKEQFVQWNVFLRSGVTSCDCSVESLSSQIALALVRRADGHYSVSAFDVIKTILVDADSHGVKYDATRLNIFTALRVLGGFFLAFTFVFSSEWWIAQRAVSSVGGMGLSVVFVLWGFCLVLVGWGYYTIISIFLGVFFIDARRRLREAALLAELMRFSDLDVNLLILQTARPLMQYSNKKDDGPDRGAAEGECDASTASAVQDMMCRRRNMADCNMDQRRRLTISLEVLDHIPSTPAPDNPAQQGPPASRVSSMRLDAPPVQDADAGDSIGTDTLASPRISTTFSGSNNVIVWTFVRGVFRNFGARYKYRLDINMITTAALNFVLLVIALGLAIYSLIYPSPADSSTRNSITSPFTIQCLVSSFNVLVFVLSVTRVSTAVNTAYHAHKFLIDGHMLETELRRTVLKEQASSTASSTRRPDIERQLDDCEGVLRALETCKQSIAVTDEMLPVTVLGVEASSSLLSAILSLAGSTLSIFVSVYMTASRKGRLVAAA